DVGFSLATTRAHHPYRAAITARPDTETTRTELLDALAALGAGHPHPRLFEHHQLAHLQSKVVFVLPGQGSQYPGMAAELYAQHRGFAAALDEVCAVLDAHLDRPLRGG